LKSFAAEARARFKADALADAELYPCDATWCGIFDRMARAPAPEETERRALTAALYGLPPVA
jgi:hypothetical protein